MCKFGPELFVVAVVTFLPGFVKVFHNRGVIAVACYYLLNNLFSDCLSSSFNPCEFILFTICLNKGLKYNLSYKNKNWIQTLALETETAIAELPPPPSPEQESIRVRAAYNIKLLYKQQFSNKPYNSSHAIKEYCTLNQIKEKLRANEAIISKADKGNSTVIM
jgi:hypothetical protein